MFVLKTFKLVYFKNVNINIYKMKKIYIYLIFIIFGYNIMGSR